MSMTRDTVNECVVRFLEYIGCGTFGRDLYFGHVPDSKQAPIRLWWVVPSNANVARHCVTGEDEIHYTYTLNYRSDDLQDVSEKLQKFAEGVLSNHCYTLPGYCTVDIRLFSGQNSTSLDLENRPRGTASFSVYIYDLPTNPEDNPYESY